MSGPTYVRITADVTDLTAKLAVAKAEFANANSDLRGMAQQMNAAGTSASGELKAGLTVAAEKVAKLRTETNSLNRELRETSNATHSGGMKDLVSFGESGLHIRFREIAESMSGLGLVIGAVFAGRQILEGIERTAELGANLVKLHEQTGIAVEALSGLHYAAEQEEVSAEAMDTSIKRLGKNVQAALKEPTSAAAEGFKALGISQDYLRENSNNTLPILMKMADGFHAHADGAQADAIAMATLGRGGVDLIPLLREGSGEIQKLIDKQKSLGSQITGPMAEAMKEHGDAVKDMKEAWGSAWIGITNAALPALTLLAHSLQGLVMLAHDATAGIRAAVSLFGLVSEKTGGPVNLPANRTASGHPYKMGSDETKPEFGNFAGKEKKTKEPNDFYAQWKEQLDKALLAQQLFGQEAQAFELKFWQEKLVIAEAGGKNYVGTTRSITSTVYQLESQQHRQVLEEARRAEQEKKRLLDEGFRNFKASIDAEREAASGNISEQLRLDQQLIDRAKELYGQDSANFQEALRRKSADMRAQVDQQMQPFKRAADTIAGSFDEMFRGMLEGTQNFRQAMGRLTLSLIEDFARMAIRNVETWALSKLREVMVTEQAEAQKTAASVVGSTARTSAGLTENAGFFGRVAAQVASWLGLETGKTAETTVGVSTRAAATLAATAATIAAAKAEAIGEIPAYTGIAAMGAASAVAPIPIIGPALATAAFAEMQGLGVSALAIASAAGGMDIGAGVNPITQLHEKEMVLPAGLSERVRSMTDPGGKGDVHLGGITYAPVFHGNQKINAEDHGNAVVDIIKHAIRIGKLKPVGT